MELKAPIRPSKWQDLEASFRMEPERASIDLKDGYLIATGLFPSEIGRDVESGPLNDLKASTILSGPFKIGLTPNPSQHLTFDETETYPTVLLLNFRRVRHLHRLQCIGASTYFPH